MIAAVGVKNLVIIDTGDAVLVADRERAQQVKLVVERFAKPITTPRVFIKRLHRRGEVCTVLEDGTDAK